LPHVVTIWQCAMKNASARLWLETRIPRLLGDDRPAETEAAMVAEDPTPYRTRNH
jgi:hypothetical protein